MGTIGDAFRAVLDKSQELVKETVNSIAELIEQYYKEKQKKDKERFFPSDQLAFLVIRTQNTKKPCGDKPHMFWSGFV